MFIREWLNGKTYCVLFCLVGSGWHWTAPRSDAIRGIAIRGIAIRGLVPLDPVMHKYPWISYLHRDYVCVGDLASSRVVNPAHSAHTGFNTSSCCFAWVDWSLGSFTDLWDAESGLSNFLLDWSHIIPYLLNVQLSFDSKWCGTHIIIGPGRLNGTPWSVPNHGSGLTRTNNPGLEP